MSPVSAVSAIDHARALDLLQRLVSIPTPSGKEQQAAELLVQYLRAAGLDDVRRDEHGNILVTVKGKAAGPRRAFFTHTDSAGAGQMQGPYEPRIVDGEPFGKRGKVLRGLGAVAPKSAVAALVEALRAVVTSADPLTGTIHLAIVTKDLLADHAGPKELFRSFPFEADWMVAGEPSGNRLVLGARGIGHYRVTFTGKTTHNGRPRDGVNPLFAVADLLAAIEAFDLPTHPSLGPATISPFEVASEAAPPLTPSRAHVVLDRRTLPGERTADVQSAIERIVASITARRPGTGSSIERLRAMHSFDTAPDSPLVVRLQDAARRRLGTALETTYISFSSNAGYAIAEKGWEGVGFGPGHITDLGNDEHVEISQVEEATRIFAALMEA